MTLSKELGSKQVSVTEGITCLYSCAPNILSATTVFVSLHLFFAWSVQCGLTVKLSESQDLVMTFISCYIVPLPEFARSFSFLQLSMCIVCRICHWLWWHQSKHPVPLCLGLYVPFPFIILRLNAFGECFFPINCLQFAQDHVC